MGIKRGIRCWSRPLNKVHPKKVICRNLSKVFQAKELSFAMQRWESGMIYSKYITILIDPDPKIVSSILVIKKSNNILKQQLPVHGCRLTQKNIFEDFVLYTTA